MLCDAQYYRILRIYCEVLEKTAINFSHVCPTLGAHPRNTRRDAAEGMTALAAAVFNGRTENARVLLARGADPSIPTADGRAPVFLAASGGHLPALRLLLDAFGKDRTTETWRSDAAGCTPIMVASMNGHLECLRALVESEPAVGMGGERTRGNRLSMDGEFQQESTSVTAAPAWEGRREGKREGRMEGITTTSSATLRVTAGTLARVCEKLNIHAGDGDINDIDNEGRTALMHACMFNQVQYEALGHGTHQVGAMGGTIDTFVP